MFRKFLSLLVVLALLAMPVALAEGGKVRVGSRPGGEGAQEQSQGAREEAQPLQREPQADTWPPWVSVEPCFVPEAPQSFTLGTNPPGWPFQRHSLAAM